MEIILTDEQFTKLKPDELLEMIFLSWKEEHSVYNEFYTYDDMKIIFAFHKFTTDVEVDYEELCALSQITHCLWDAAFAQKHNFPNTYKNTFQKLIWRLVEIDERFSKLPKSAEGYSQEYASNIGKLILEKYLEFGRK